MKSWHRVLSRRFLILTTLKNIILLWITVPRQKQYHAYTQAEIIAGNFYFFNWPSWTISAKQNKSLFAHEFFRLKFTAGNPFLYLSCHLIGIASIVTRVSIQRHCKMKTVVYRNAWYSAVTGKFVPFRKLGQNLAGIVSQVACKTTKKKSKDCPLLPVKTAYLLIYIWHQDKVT